MADPVTELRGMPGARPSVPGLRLDQPALVLAGGPPVPGAAMWDAADRQAIVQLHDSSWRLCRVTAWQRRDTDIWLCELRWGVSGCLYQATYVYDPASVRQV